MKLLLSSVKNFWISTRPSFLINRLLFNDSIHEKNIREKNINLSRISRGPWWKITPLGWWIYAELVQKGFGVSIRSVKSSSGAFLRRPRNFSSFHRHFPSTSLLLIPAYRRFVNVLPRVTVPFLALWELRFRDV